MQLLAQDFAEVVDALKAASQSDGGEQRRGAARMDLEAQVRAFPVRDGVVGQLYTALTRDVSFRGVALFQSKPLAKGQQLVVVLPRGAERESLAILCVVTHCQALADGLYSVSAAFAKPFDFAAAPSANILAGVRAPATSAGQTEAELNRIRQSILD